MLSKLEINYLLNMEFEEKPLIGTFANGTFVYDINADGYEDESYAIPIDEANSLFDEYEE